MTQDHSTEAARNDGETRALLVCSAGHMLTHLYMLIFPAIAMLAAREFEVPLGEALGWSFAGYLLYGLGAPVAGFLADRVGVRPMLVLNLVGMSASAVLIGFAPGPAALIGGLSLLGLFGSIYHPCGIGYLSMVATRRGHALGVNGMAGNLGLAAAPLVAGLIAAHHGWRSAYVSLGVFGLCVSIPLLLGRLPDAQRAAKRDEQPVTSRRQLVTVFLLLCGAMTLAGLTYRATSLSFPAYFSERALFLTPALERWSELFDFLPGGRETAAGTLLTTLLYIVGIFGQYFGGILADRIDLRLVYLGFHVLTLPCLVALAMLTEVSALTAGMLYVFFGLGMQPAENSLVAKLSPPQWRSTVYGLKFILTFGVGAFAVGLTSAIAERWDLSAVFAACGIFALGIAVLAAGVWFGSRRELPRLVNA